MHKIAAYLDESMVVHLCPRDAADVILFKYLKKELQTHGVALIDIETTTDKYRQLEKAAFAEVMEAP